MVTVNETQNTEIEDSKRSGAQDRKHLKLIGKTFQNNKDSDYTEKIRDLRNEFNYASNSN